MLRRIGKSIAVILGLVVLLFGYNAVRYLLIWQADEAVSFENDGIRFEGTLFKPKKDGVFPAVIILHGSGAETRREPSYRVAARTMLAQGFAILLYDKRGSGASGGDLDSATYGDLASDAHAALRFLQRRADIDSRNIGLFANSESGWFAPEVAAESRKIAFIINRVGPPLPWIDTVIWEVRNDLREAGIAESDLDEILGVTLKRWSYYQAAANDPALAAASERDALNAEIARVYASVPGADRVMNPQLGDYDPEFYSTFAAKSAYDPDPFLRRIDIPLLYIFGELDINVPTAQSVEYLEALRERYPSEIAIYVYPGLNHSLFTWRGLLHGGYPPDYLDRVGDWARAKVRE